MRDKPDSRLTDEDARTKLTYRRVFLLIGAVSLFMTVLNYFTHKGTVTAVTGIFTVLCLINCVLITAVRKHGKEIAAGLFMAELIALLAFFIVSGSPDGFSAIWTAMLPGCGMLLFGRKKTAVMSMVMFLILAFFFWVPAGKALLQYEYSATFMTRFPILFAAFFLVAFLLESVREAAQKELNEMRDHYRYYAAHDYVTNLLNRRGLQEWRASFKDPGEQTVMMIDIDHFKKVNDSFGHDIGDMVLAGVAERIEACAGIRVTRWGGEEFVAWFHDSSKACDPEEIRRSVEEMEIRIPNSKKTVRVTVSIGVASGRGDLETLVKTADEAMYRAKNNGRNRVEYAA